MVITKNWVYGHLAKTGGDAVHQWCRQLVSEGHLDSQAIIDSLNGPAKHDPFVARPTAQGKEKYVLGMRRLPSWTLSFLHEVTRSNRAIMMQYGWQTIEQVLRPESALAAPFADLHLQHIDPDGERVTDWLRSESLLKDFTKFLSLTTETAELLQRVPTKTRHDRDARQFFTRRQIYDLYRLNSRWAAYECMVYGELW